MLVVYNKHWFDLLTLLYFVGVKDSLLMARSQSRANFSSFGKENKHTFGPLL